MDRQTERRTIRLLDGGPLWPGHKILMIMPNILEMLFPKIHILKNLGVLSKGNIILVHVSDVMN